MRLALGASNLYVALKCPLRVNRTPETARNACRRTHFADSMSRAKRSTPASDTTQKPHRERWVLILAVAAALALRMAQIFGSRRINAARAIAISDSPRIVVVDDFVDDETMRTLEAALPSASAMNAVDTLDKSRRGGAQRRTGRVMGFNGRTSEWPQALADLVPRLDDLAEQPADHGEGLSIVSYDVGEKYELHLDSTQDGRVRRVASAILFVESPAAGGELVFPWARVNQSAIAQAALGGIEGPGRPPEDAAAWGSAPPTLEQVCRPELHALRIQPKRGRLVVFYSHATRDSPLLFPQAMHGSCPVRAGRKRIAQRFYWAKAPTVR